MNAFDKFLIRAAALMVSFILGWAETKKKNDTYPQWVQDILTLAEACNMQEVVRSALIACRSEKPVAMGCLVGALIPHEFTKLNLPKPDTRLKNWVEVCLSGLCQFGWIVAVPKGVEYTTDPSNPYAKAYGIGFVLGTLKVEMEDEEPRVLNVPNDSPVYTSRTLGTMWAKSGNELDHCAETIQISNSIPLQWNIAVLNAMGGKFYLSEAQCEDWDHEKFKTFEEYCAHRQEQFDSYISKIPTSILEKGADAVVYNTYAPDSRGRWYPTNDTYNYVGIKQVRALLKLANGAAVSKEESEFFADFE
jgi:hypothetical protein